MEPPYQLGWLQTSLSMIGNITWFSSSGPLPPAAHKQTNDSQPTNYTGWRKKTGPAYLIANILKIPRPNCVEIGELLQYYMLNTVINFSFKILSCCGATYGENSYCVMLKSICTMWINDSSCVFARWRHSAIKFLNKKLTTVFSP